MADIVTFNEVPATNKAIRVSYMFDILAEDT